MKTILPICENCEKEKSCGVPENDKKTIQVAKGVYKTGCNKFKLK
jgi:hypothetical protein